MFNTTQIFRREGVDRRRYPRLRSYDLLKFVPQVGQEENSAEVLSRIFDISEGGLRLVSPFPIVPNMRLKLKINFMEKLREITAVAERKWCEKSKKSNGRYYHIGVAFIALDTDDKRLIRECIESVAANVSERRTKI